MGSSVSQEEKVRQEGVWKDVKEDMLELMASAKDKNYDDGTYGPLFIRLAWHSSGTYDAESGTGGSNGASMRFAPESTDPENAGLDIARDLLETIKSKYPDLSYSDIWIFAAYVFLEQSGGPSLQFVPGRVDKTEEEGGVENGRLPAAEYGVEDKTVEDIDADQRVENWQATADHVKQVFTRMGFTLQEACALICGGHLYGRCHPDRSGYNGKWVAEPTVWSNEYAADMIEDTWVFINKHSKMNNRELHQEVCPAGGKKQYIKKLTDDDDWNEDQQMMLVADMILVWDDDFRPHLEKYAEDEELLKKEFGEAFKKLTELGCPWAEES